MALENQWEIFLKNSEFERPLEILKILKLCDQESCYKRFLHSYISLFRFLVCLSSGISILRFVILPCSVCGSILLGGPPSPASLLPRQGTRTRSAYAVNGNPVAAVRHGKRSVLVHEIAIEALHVPLRSANIPFKRVQSDLSWKIILSPSPWT